MHDRGEVERVLGSGFEGHFDFSDDNNYKSNTLNPEFNWWHELDGILPSISTLEVALYDHGYITDTLIGRTYIDLEDRWFDNEWRRLRDVQQIPRENRVLLNDYNRVPQGKMEMWIELYEPKKSIDIPIVPIESPQVTEWELRLVVWETREKCQSFQTSARPICIFRQSYCISRLMVNKVPSKYLKLTFTTGFEVEMGSSIGE